MQFVFASFGIRCLRSFLGGSVFQNEVAVFSIERATYDCQILACKHMKCSVAQN